MGGAASTARPRVGRSFETPRHPGSCSAGIAIPPSHTCDVGGCGGWKGGVFQGPQPEPGVVLVFGLPVTAGS